MSVVKITGLVAAIASLAGSLAQAQSPPKSVSTISPIFGQLLMSGHPPGFGLAPAFEKTKDNFYIRESVPNGENVNNWTQMITVTGMKDAASKPEITPRIVLNNMAGGFKRACPSSFGAQVINENKVSGFDAIVGVVSCGLSPTNAGKTSESALMIVIKGQADFYTIQWAERATPSAAPIPIELQKWSDRFKKLNPIKLCPIVPGEKAPYPSCAGSGFKQPAQRAI